MPRRVPRRPKGLAMRRSAESIFIIFGGGMYVAKNTFHGAECASAANARSTAFRYGSDAPGV